MSYGDIVEVFDGPLKGRSGTVKHIMRGFLFIQSRDIQENGGFVCVQARHCKVRGGKRLPGVVGPGGLLATPARTLATPNPYGANVLASPAHGSNGGDGTFGGPRGMAAGGYGGRLATHDDRLLIGKVVEIKKGPYKGMRGMIKSATGTHVRVELEARMQMVNVSRQHLGTQDGGLTEAPRSMGMGMGMPAGYAVGAAPAPGGRTPAHWSQGGVTATPAHYSAMGSATPMHPGMTPGREAVGKTPAYDPAWAATPAYTGFGSSAADAGPGGMGFGGLPGFGGPTPGLGGGDASGMAPVAKAPAAVRVPVDDAEVQDWVGLEAVLPDGETVAVRSVTAQGEASVQIGREVNGHHVFADGSVRSVNVADLELASYSKGDTLRVLVGLQKGQTGTLELQDKKEVFIKVPVLGLQVVPATICAKVAVDYVEKS